MSVVECDDQERGIAVGGLHGVASDVVHPFLVKEWVAFGRAECHGGNVGNVFAVVVRAVGPGLVVR